MDRILLSDLRAARRQAGLSQQGLSERIGSDALKVSRLERGMGSVETLIAMINALDFILRDWLLGRACPSNCLTVGGDCRCPSVRSHYALV